MNSRLSAGAVPKLLMKQADLISLSSVV